MKKRVISAVVLLAVTFVCVLLSTVSRVVYFGIIALLCAYEWGKNLRVRDVNCADWVLYVMFVGLTTVTVLHGGVFWYAAVLVGAAMLSMTAGVVQKSVSGFGAMFTAAGVAYLGVLFAAILAISVSPIWLASFALGFATAVRLSAAAASASISSARVSRRTRPGRAPSAARFRPLLSARSCALCPGTMALPGGS